jgi:hypothetical protein
MTLRSPAPFGRQAFRRTEAGGISRAIAPARHEGRRARSAGFCTCYRRCTVECCPRLGGEGGVPAHLRHMHGPLAGLRRRYDPPRTRRAGHQPIAILRFAAAVKMCSPVFGGRQRDRTGVGYLANTCAMDLRPMVIYGQATGDPRQARTAEAWRKFIVAQRSKARGMSVWTRRGQDAPPLHSRRSRSRSATDVGGKQSSECVLTGKRD